MISRYKYDLDIKIFSFMLNYTNNREKNILKKF